MKTLIKIRPEENKRCDVRLATATDVPLILDFIRELAEYEKLAHEVTATEDMLRKVCSGRVPMPNA
jgi:hypothetical protein